MATGQQSGGRAPSDRRWTSVGMRVLINSLAHPVEYAKVLMQLGYEPVPPATVTSPLGKPALGLPNVLQYVNYIHSVDGFWGCYRGLTARLCANAVTAVVFSKVSDALAKEEYEKVAAGMEEGVTEEERRWLYGRRLGRDVAARLVAITVSHPLHVVALRSMAQFVGLETEYGGIFTSLAAIYRQNGLSGYFQGLVPRLLGELAALGIATSLTLAINRYFVDDRDVRHYVSSAMSFVASVLTYPLQVVATCMAVNGSGLAAGRPPYMPVYSSWTDCWSHLAKEGQLTRGGCLFWRFATGPAGLVPVPASSKKRGRSVPIPKPVRVF